MSHWRHSRSTAGSAGEIRNRHLGTGVFELSFDCVPEREIGTLRETREIVDIYTRALDETVYRPLSVPEYLAPEGEREWVICADPIDRSAAPRVVGIMLAKDESDAIPEVFASLVPALDALYYFAGDAATEEAIARCAPDVGWARRVEVPSVPHADGLRHYLLEQARRDAISDGDARPMWVAVVQGDEIYHDDLRSYILRAYREGANAMACQVATFLLHKSQESDWDWEQPLAQRLTHYIWDFGEHSGFLDMPWIYYDPGVHMRAHPHGLFPGKYASARPIRKHYPFRSPEQARARLEDRLRGSEKHPEGWQPHYRNYLDVFLEDEAAGRPIKKYEGNFAEAERVQGEI